MRAEHVKGCQGVQHKCGGVSGAEGPGRGGFTDELCHDLTVQVGEGLCLGHSGQVVHGKAEAELLQALKITTTRKQQSVDMQASPICP